MQQIIPLLQRTKYFNKLVFIASGKGGRADPHFVRIAADIGAAINDSVEWYMFDEAVDPMAPHSVAAVVSRAIEANGGSQEVVVNITGGTKPMSIGAYLAAADMAVPRLYVDTQNEKLFLYQGKEVITEIFDLRPITVRQYLYAHGREIDEKATQKLAFSEAESGIAKAILDCRPESLTWMMVMRSQAFHAPMNKSGEKRIQERLWRPLQKMVCALQNAGWLRQEKGEYLLSVPGFHFLEGGWLEAYVYTALKESGRFMDVVGRVHTTGDENEIDVACTLNAKLGIIECKSSAFQGQAILNRLLALKETLAGTFGKTFFVTSRYPDRLSEVNQLRAAEYISRLIGMDELAYVEGVIYKTMVRGDNCDRNLQ